MEIRNRTTGELTTVSYLQAANPYTSFPKQITSDILDLYDYDPVLEGPQPDLSGPYERCIRDGVEEVEGQWFKKYIIGPVFVDDLDDDGNPIYADDLEAEYRASVDASVAASVRESRNQLLADSDWTQLLNAALSDSQVSSWAAYRQALRDLPETSGFPHEVTWPELPA